MSNAAFLGEADSRATGSVEFGWIEHGAALVMRQYGDTGPPAAVWIFGRDTGDAGYQVHYADDRGVSRIYAMSFDATHWRMWRRTPEFSQRFEAELSPGAQSIKGEWKKSFDGGVTWAHDFDLEYTR